MNLPVVPVHDFVVKEDDLVAATHGRSFWILDDLTPLQQLTDEVASSKAYLFKPRDTYRARGFNAVINYYLKDSPEEDVALEFLDTEGKVIKTFKKKEKEEIPEQPSFQGRSGNGGVPTEAGLNRFEWDMYYPDARGIKGGTHLHGGSLRGPIAVPGTYQVRLIVGGQTFTESFQIKKNPQLSTTQEDFQKKFDLLIKIQDKLILTHDTINQILDIKEELKVTERRVKGLESEKIISEDTKKIKEKLDVVLNELFAPRIRSSVVFNSVLFTPLIWRDSLKLNNRFANVKSVIEGAETKPANQCYENFNELSPKLDIQLAKLKEILEKDIPAFNRLIEEKGIPAIAIK